MSLFEPGAAATFRYIYAGMDGGAAAAGDRDSAVSGEYIYNGGGGGNNAAAGDQPADVCIENEPGDNGDLPGFPDGTVEVYGEGDVEQGYRIDFGGPGRQPSLEM